MSVGQNRRLYASLPMLSGAHCVARINLSALRHNYRLLCDAIGQVTPICVVKADAYGHGAPLVASALYEEGCRYFAVASIEEALALREALSEPDILILGSVSPAHVPSLAAHKLTAAIYSKDMALALSDEASRLGLCIRAHVKLDTGMNRLGFAAFDKEARTRTLSELCEIYTYKNLDILGVFSHFATADAPCEELSTAQAERFEDMINQMERLGLYTGQRHLCNTAGALRFPKYRMNAVRIGLALYGYLPYEGEPSLPLLPVMRLLTRVTHVHTLPPTESVGYGATYHRTDSPRTIATLGIGYADGFIRAYDGASVTVHTESGDFSAPIVGRICMDQCMLDVTDIPVKAGDEVTLFGGDTKSLPLLAKRADTIPYESLCLVSARVPREVEN